MQQAKEKFEKMEDLFQEKPKLDNMQNADKSSSNHDPSARQELTPSKDLFTSNLSPIKDFSNPLLNNQAQKTLADTLQSKEQVEAIDASVRSFDRGEKEELPLLEESLQATENNVS